MAAANGREFTRTPEAGGGEWLMVDGNGGWSPGRIACVTGAGCGGGEGIEDDDEGEGENEGEVVSGGRCHGVVRSPPLDTRLLAPPLPLAA